MRDLFVLLAFVASASARPQGIPHLYGAPGIANLPPSSLPVSISYSSTVPLEQSTSTNAPPETTGVDTTLSVATTSAVAALSQNIFQPIATNTPPSQIRIRSDHPVPKLGISNLTTPVQTNKFYANLFLGQQNNGVWTHPYSLTWARGSGKAGSWGLSVAHIERSQLYFDTATPPQYFINPTSIQSIVLSAAELKNTTALTTDSLGAFSVNANLAPAAGATPLITFPLVQGMGFVTALYNGATVFIESGVYFKTLTRAGSVNSNATYKWRITLSDDTNWLLYVSPTGSAGVPPFTLRNITKIVGPSSFYGTIQVAKNNQGAVGEQYYDNAAGAYPINATVSGSVSSYTGSYTISYQKGGSSIGQTLLMYALPHHMQCLDATMQSKITPIQLETTTKGMATAIAADELTMREDLKDAIEIGFAPWSPSTGSIKSVSAAAARAINDAATVELQQNMSAQTNLNSMYYSGKGLSKFATIVWAAQELAGNSSLAAAGLKKLEAAFDVFVQNQQQFPLVWDSVWKGAVSSAAYVSGNLNDDFGNTGYNDHHFHYSYFVGAASVIAYLNPSWLTQGTNKAFINMLIRDYSNSIDTDPYFPFSRSFDWYHGHSWAKGLFDSVDGKDQESSSEDTWSLLSVKNWARVTGDAALEARATLQLAIHARSLQNYYLLASDNTVQPPQYIPNKVSGILFENKCAHTTYFGTNPEYVEGIHMIPINPASAYTRTRQFVTEEWQTYFVNNVSTIPGGWRGILMANLAIVDPSTSYNFFAAPDFDDSVLDGGASRTWYLAYAAGLQGL